MFGRINIPPKRENFLSILIFRIKTVHVVLSNCYLTVYTNGIREILLN